MTEGNRLIQPTREPSTADAAGSRLSRRRLVQTGLAVAAAAALPAPVAARARRPGPRQPTPINPYSGSIPLTFPLSSGSYQTPVANNWHQSREGQQYAWSHRDSKVERAHDGVDVFPSSATLPTVYAPLQATVAAVCLRSDNTVGATVTYNVSSTTPPPWNYSQAVDNVADLPLYGNFVWLYSTDPASAGYFVFFCHLQNDATLQALSADEPVTVNTAVGTMGDTGNAAGSPQLHVEIHFPSGHSFTCTHCSPRKSGVTAIDPFASLTSAAVRG